MQQRASHQSGRLICWVTLAVLAIGTSAVAASYTITDLGSLGGAGSHATGINNKGQVVGWSAGPPEHGSPGAASAFLWQNGSMIGLSDFGSTSTAWGINDAGAVVAQGAFSSYGHSYGAVYGSGQTTVLPYNQTGNSDATGINNKGEIVGHNDWGQGAQAAYWSSSSASPVMIGGLTWAYKINNSGTIIGNTSGIGTDGESLYHAAVWTNGIVTDLGTLGGRDSNAFGMNDKGQVVGWAFGVETSNVHAVAWLGGAPVDLGLGEAWDINEAGQIVGGIDAGGAGYRGFLWENGTRIFLEDLIPDGSGWTNLGSAVGINDLGQIVGNGYINGQSHGFIMTPVVAPSPVPEPSTVLLLGSGLVGLFAIGRRRACTRTEKLL